MPINHSRSTAGASRFGRLTPRNPIRARNATADGSLTVVGRRLTRPNRVARVVGRRYRSGYSLIEVMTATFLLSMAVLGFSALYPVAAKSSKMNGNYAQAVSIAQHKVDQLRAIGFGRLSYSEMLNAGIIDAAPGASPFSFNTVDGLANYFPSYSGTITLTSLAADLTQVTVTVSWAGQGDKATQGNCTLVALLAEE